MYQYVASLDATGPFVLRTASPAPVVIEAKSAAPVGTLNLSTIIVEESEDGPALLVLLNEVRLKYSFHTVGGSL